VVLICPKSMGNSTIMVRKICMEIILVLAILLIALVANYVQKLYYARTEKGKLWVQCYRCKGKGSIRSDRYGTNGVEVWPLDDICPTCKGRGKVEDHSPKYAIPQQDIVKAVKSTSTRYCSTCHLPMKIRIAKKGPHQGEKFFVCPNFKECKESYLVE
jgi:hypothetical protein